jgi:PAS domain S-box-containing protein
MELNGDDLRKTVHHAPIGICILDAATLVTEIVNDKFLEVAGKPYKAIHGRFYWDAFAEARPYYEAALNQVVQTGQAFYADEVKLMLIRHGREEIIFVTFVYSPIKNAAGQVERVSVWVLENTKQVAERLKVEAAKVAFQKERDRLKKFFMNAPAGICILAGPELVFELVNPGYQQLLPGRALLNRPIFEALPELTGTPLQEVLQNVYRTGEPYDINELLIPVAEYEGGPTRDRYFSFNYQARRDENEQVDGILVFVFEVTAMIQVQQEQLAMNEELTAFNEEAAAANEELTASNEELIRTQRELQNQSEELAAANEELAAMNEEMAAINEELTVTNEELNETQASLQLSEKLFKSIALNIPKSLIIVIDKEHRYVTIEGEIMEKLGYDSKNYTGKHPTEVSPAERYEVNRPLFERVMSGEQFSMERKTETGEYFRVYFVPLNNDKGEVERGLIIALDISDIKDAEEKSAKLAAIISSSDDAIVSKTLESVITSWNDSAERVFGYTAEEIIGQTIYKLIPPDRQQEEPEILRRLKNGERVEHFETKRLTKDGRLIDVSVTVSPVKDSQGNIIGLSKIARDITASRRLTEELEVSETRFRFMLNAIPQQVWTARPDGMLDYVNQVVCDDFGYSTEEIVGHGWQAFIHPDDLPACLEKWQKALLSGNEYVAEFRLKFRDGSYHWHLARALPFAEGKQVKLWLGTNTNIDAQKMNEQRKDEFLSIASHELKTPLTSIKAYNQIIQRINDPEKLKPFIRKSADHIVRLERLIADLLDVTKINAGKMNYVFEPVNIKNLLKDSVEAIQHTVTSHEIILESAPDIDYNGDHLRLEQVLHNFLSNAIKYSPDGKTILVNGQVDHGNVIVSVQDFGIGIARENLDRLFDRYYRVDNTAMRFEGLGLGLFISAEILRKHGGSFWIESEQGKGSTFYFRLPLEGTEKPLVTRTATFYRDQHLVINFNQTKKRLEVDWTGFQDLESVKHGCMLMWEYLQQNHCDRVVNDNTHVMGNWSEATDWVGNIWFPMMEKAGLKYFAHVFSPSTFSQLAAIKSIDIMAGIITTQYFTDVKLAEDWIELQ